MKLKIFECKDCNVAIAMLPEETRARCPKCKEIIIKHRKIDKLVDYLKTAEFGGVVNCRVENTEGYL